MAVWKSLLIHSDLTVILFTCWQLFLQSLFVEAHVSRFGSDSVAGVGVVPSSRCFHIFDVSVSDLVDLFSPIFFREKKSYRNQGNGCFITYLIFAIFLSKTTLPFALLRWWKLGEARSQITYEIGSSRSSFLETLWITQCILLWFLFL